MATVTQAVLEERITNYVRFFTLAMTLVVAWLAWVSTTVYSINRDVGKLSIAQANSTSTIVAGLLNQVPATQAEAAANLSAAVAVMKSAKLRKQKPTPDALKSVSLALLNAQSKYPDLPEAWTATGQFIDYKSMAILPAMAERNIAKARTLECKSIYIGPPVVFEGCTLDLEGIDVATRSPIFFVNSVVRYSGGQIKLSAPALRFQNCVFDFQILLVPPPRARQMMQLLASSVGPDFQITI